MTKQELLARIEEVGIIPAVRVASAADAVFAAESVFANGIPVVEITMTIPSAGDVIAQLIREHPDTIVGAGTVLDIDTARLCLKAGAVFLTSTGMDPDVVAFVIQHDVFMIPGA